MKFNRWLAIILSVLLVFTFTTVAFAEEGGLQDPVPEEGDGPVDPSGDDPVGPVDPVDPGDDPSSSPDDPTPPPDEPTPPPEDDPTPGPPDSSDPNGGGDDPSSSEPGEDDPTGPIEPSGDDPVTPSPEPYNPGYTGGSTSSTGGGSSSSSAPPRSPSGQTIRQPSLSPGVRATPKPVSSGQPEEPENLEPNYITFARLSQKNNSMSIVLFYSGAACVAVGLLGLMTLAIFIVRGRRLDQREGIFEEIEQAETRRSPAQTSSRRRTAARRTPPPPPEPPSPQYEPDPDPSGYQAYDPGYQDARQPLHHPEPEELAMPVNGSLYTEEFEIPAQAYQEQVYQEQQVLQQQPLQQQPLQRPQNYRQQPPSAGMYTEEFQRPAQRPAAPPQASMYTEEFSIPEPGRGAAPQSSRRGTESSGTGYDTNELLRELLDGDGGRQKKG